MSVEQYIKRLEFDQSLDILDGSSVSGAKNIYGMSLVGLIVPSGLTGAILSFQGAKAATGTYYNVKNASGDTLTVDYTGAGFYQFNTTDFSAIQFLKLVSNATQLGNITIDLVLRSF